jgi:hypothetical protein
MEYLLLGVGLSLLTQVGLLALKVGEDFYGISLLVLVLCPLLGLKARSPKNGLSLRKKFTLKWTLFLVQSKKIRELKERVETLEADKGQLLQELNGLQELWLRTQEKPTPRTQPLMSNLLNTPRPASKFFNDNFFDLHASPLHSHSIREKLPDEPFR